VPRYLRIRCLIHSSDEDALAGALDGVAVLGSSIEPAAADRAEAMVYLKEGDHEAVALLMSRLHRLGVETSPVEIEEDGDWIAEYRRRAQPYAVGGRWWIDPGLGQDQTAPDGRTVLVVEPTTAFGSGSHESTQLVLMALESLDLKDRAVIDLGTGSGILALAADALGAETVVALDIDPQAVVTARWTALRQPSPVHPVFVAGTADCLQTAPYTVVLCNMLQEEVLGQLDHIKRLLAKEGKAVLSGMLQSQRGDLDDALLQSGFRTEDELEHSGWIARVVIHG
jgi:ribosomal protein L11 methyltransferase